MKTVDLHGVRHKDVSDIISRCCNDFDVPFIVITGKSSQMKRIVLAVAEHFGLTMRDAIDNPGRVVVDENR
tara:strand:- start:1871 stop:2083 length:213 start_codon:yes stop_codon:yes gene_type:complete